MPVWQLEFEVGGLRERSADARRSGTPCLFKLAFDKGRGLLVGGEVHVWPRDVVGRAKGNGDTFFTLKRAGVVDEASALGLELGVTLPTAEHTVGSGKADDAVSTIYCRDLGPVHIDANLNALRLGVVDAGSSHLQWGISISIPLSALLRHHR